MRTATTALLRGESVRLSFGKSKTEACVSQQPSDTGQQKLTGDQLREVALSVLGESRSEKAASGQSVKVYSNLLLHKPGNLIKYGASKMWSWEENGVLHSPC